jgi:hypothetical protein
MKIVRGFTIRLHRTGTDKYQDEYQNVWAEAGQTPQEWNEVKQSPDVDQAQLYSSTQRRVRADKRRILDTKEVEASIPTTMEPTSPTYYKNCAFCAKECQGH